jgi:peptidoglycan/LPS O-acetylase OafA/YrhL
LAAAINHRRHLTSLDGLRGLAVVMVYFFHYYPKPHPLDPFLTVARFGWLGVDLFFVLSGFLITGILYDTREMPGFFRNFYGRRALRLFPIYIVFSAVVVGVSMMYGTYPTRYTWPTLFYFSNIVMVFPLPLGISSKLQVAHIWSLAVEEQFYLLWPVVLFALRTRERILKGCFWGIAIAIVLRIALNFGGPRLWVPYFQLPTRMDAILVGGALALLLRGDSTFPHIGNRAMYWICGLCTAIISGAAALSHSSYWNGEYTVLLGYSTATVLFAGVIVMALRHDNFFHHLGDWPPLRFVGRYGYGFYLWHALPGHFVEKWIYDADVKFPVRYLGGILAFVFFFFVFLGVAIASYHLIELPFLKLKRLFAYSDEKRTHQLIVDQDVKESVPAS